MIVIKADYLYCYLIRAWQLWFRTAILGLWHVFSGWLSECLRIKPFADFTAFCIFADVYNFLLLVLLPPIYSARISRIQLIHYPCHPLITWCIYIETVYIYNIHSRFATSNISCPSVYCIALSPLWLHILLRSILYSGLAYRLALDFSTSSPYLQRMFFSMEWHQFLLDMFILDITKFS